MIEVAHQFAMIAVLVAIFFCLWRLLKGPKLTDRILALDTLYTNAIAWLILEFFDSSGHAFDIVLVIALLSFGSTVALCKYIIQRRLL